MSDGWRCLEVGGGNGSVAAWLVERTQPQGSCVAIDIDLRLVRWLAPGGMLAFEEVDGLTARHTDEPAWQRLWAAVAHFPAFDIDCGRSLPRPFTQAGLADVTAAGWLPIVRGGTTQAQWHQLNIGPFGPAIVRAGVLSQPEFDDLVVRIDQADFLQFRPTWISCSGRRRRSR